MCMQFDICSMLIIKTRGQEEEMHHPHLLNENKKETHEFPDFSFQLRTGLLEKRLIQFCKGGRFQNNGSTFYWELICNEWETFP